MTQMNVDIPEEMTKQLTWIQSKGGYATQSEMVREALRNFITIKLSTLKPVDDKETL